MEVKDTVPIAELLSLMADGTPRLEFLNDRLWNNDWAVYDVEARKELRPVLLTHPDPLVRERAALALEAWRDVAGLIDLVRDRDLSVSKSAMYYLGQLPPTRGIADLAWEHLHRHETLGTHATETLGTFVRHAATEEAIRRLSGIAGNQAYRENLRVSAVYDLAKIGTADEIGI